jgi:uncharacterized sulfatase
MRRKTSETSKVLEWIGLPGAKTPFHYNRCHGRRDSPQGRTTSAQTIWNYHMVKKILRPELLVASLLGFLPAVFATAGDAGANRPPNIIVILADDLGYGDLACYGHKAFRTPHLDRMAAEGVRFTQFNAPMSFCAPTRASLLTGRYPLRCGMPDNPFPDGTPAANELALPATEATLATLLQNAGYKTAMIGKWHLGHARPEFMPKRRGFDEYLGILYSNDMRPVRLMEGEKVIEYPLVQATITERYTQRALDVITRHRDKPFFLYFAHAMPHKPLAVSEEFYKKHPGGLYGDTIAELDASVGRVLAKVKELGIDESTLVIFTSDNGPWYGGSTGGLRGMKGSTWEGGYRVPMIARWPQRIPAGKTTDALATTPDLFATVLAAAGVAAPKDRVLDGKDLLPVMMTDAKSPHDVIFGHAGRQLATVRDARWKLHVHARPAPAQPRRAGRWIDPRAPDGVTILAPYEQPQPDQFPGIATGDAPAPMMLFDLENDPSEQKNVATEKAEVIVRLKKHYDGMLHELRQ